MKNNVIIFSLIVIIVIATGWFFLYSFEQNESMNEGATPATSSLDEKYDIVASVENAQGQQLLFTKDTERVASAGGGLENTLQCGAVAAGDAHACHLFVRQDSGVEFIGTLKTIEGISPETPVYFFNTQNVRFAESGTYEGMAYNDLYNIHIVTGDVSLVE